MQVPCSKAIPWNRSSHCGWR